MKKELQISTLVVFLFFSSHSFSKLEWVNNTTHGIQQDDSYRVSSEARGRQTNFLLGTFYMAVGYELTCVGSLTSHAEYQEGEYLPLTTQLISYTRTDRQSGWDNWEPGSVNQCNVNWKHVMSDGSGLSLSGVGVGISFGTSEITAAGTHIGFMIKPEEEPDGELLTCNMDFDSEGANICGDPLLVDLNNDGFHFTPAEDGVLFDIDADGRSELTAWTQVRSDDVFLFMDINGNGQVDDGGELFGDRTRLLSGNFAIDGYDALAELDQPEWGGNGDRVINRQDRYFRLLGLWSDWNQNGLSEPEEMVKLKKTKIRSLSLELEYFDVQDEHGNWIEYASWASTKRNPKRTRARKFRTADVYLRKIELVN